MDAREVGYDDRHWINLAQDRDQWRAYVVVITENVQNVHLLLEHRPHIDVSLTCVHDPKLQEYCVCPQNMPQFDSEGIPNQTPETNKPMILNGPTSRNREGSDQNQSDSLMAADGDCHHLCKLMAQVRHRWSINDVIGGIRNTVARVAFGNPTLTGSHPASAPDRARFRPQSPDSQALPISAWKTRTTSKTSPQSILLVQMIDEMRGRWRVRLGPQKGLFGQEKTKGMAYIPFYGPISGKIGRLLRKHGLKTIHKPPTKIQNLLRPVKDDLGLRTPGVYRIPCECGKCYIGQTGRTIMERCKEHQRSIRLYYPDKSAVAQHSLETGHKIDFGATTILDKTSGYWDLVIKEAIEIQLDGNNFNRDGGLQLSTA
ncbi:hypothetical protein ANN_20983 [Periplaneta americana]|uniref:GIY-YIG domain-containing protein n=1 Tax=Periplaneta americana TaxID=6978 RepID=A0ABQ8SES3_PERAM|nr:hypothetical protein ANN_20983 [Periplaneta americana]